MNSNTEQARPEVPYTPADLASLRATAAALLAGMKHARSLLDVSIRVLEYFHRHAEKDCARGTFTVPGRPAGDLSVEAERLQWMFSAFMRLHCKAPPARPATS